MPWAIVGVVHDHRPADRPARRQPARWPRPSPRWSGAACDPVAASAARRTRLLPPSGKTCFGWPIREDVPAARTIATDVHAGVGTLLGAASRTECLTRRSWRRPSRPGSRARSARDCARRMSRPIGPWIFAICSSVSRPPSSSAPCARRGCGGCRSHRCSACRASAHG